MKSRHVWQRIAIALIGGFTLSGYATAQDADLPQHKSEVEAVLGGTPTVDIINLKTKTFGIPLRFGGVIPGSERVELGSSVLKKGQDYSMDYAGGMVYLTKPWRTGQSLTVNYRYDPKQAKSSTDVGAARAFGLELAPGGMSMLMGLGIAERNKDGSVVMSNVYGLDNHFDFKGANIQGMYLVGERENIDATSGFEYQKSPNSQMADGRSELIFQRLESKLGTGKIQLEYSDVGKNFLGARAARGHGFDDETLDGLQKAAGLERTAFKLEDLSVGALGFAGSYDHVQGDEGEGVLRREMDLTAGGVKLNFGDQEIDKKFNAFNGVSKEDVKLWGRERGAEKNWLNLEADFGLAKPLKFSNTHGDTTRGDFWHREASLADEGWGLSYAAQTEAMSEKSDVGINLNLSQSSQLELSRMAADSTGGEAFRHSLAYKDSNLSLKYNTREVDKGFFFDARAQDSEKGLFNSLKGYEQQDLNLSWQINPSLSFSAKSNDLESDVFNNLRSNSHYALSWKLDPSTQFAFSSSERAEKWNDRPEHSESLDQMNITKNLGGANVVRYTHEVGTVAEDEDEESWSGHGLAYQTKIGDRTNLISEVKVKSYDDGSQEKASTNTLNMNLTDRLGASVSGQVVDKDGEIEDYKKQNYGLWYDCGNGMRVSYGFVRTLDGPETELQQSSVQVSPGTVAGVDVKDAALNATKTETTPMHTSGNLAIETAKPFSLGHVQNVRVNFGTETPTDPLAEAGDRTKMGFSGELGFMGFGYDYQSEKTASGERGIDRTYLLNIKPDPSGFITGSVKYKSRTLPWDEEIMIRDYNVTVRPLQGLEITNQTITNPEVFRSSAFLGSVTQGRHANRWQLAYKQSADLTLSVSYNELIDEQNKGVTRTSGLTATLFGGQGSPLSLFYGVERGRQGDLSSSTVRYNIRYDQRSGPNQVFSFFLGNVSYGGDLSKGKLEDSLTVKLDYQLKF